MAREVARDVNVESGGSGAAVQPSQHRDQPANPDKRSDGRPRRGRSRRWRHSLYWRAALFLVLGSACLIGAVIKLSSIVADDSVERLLRERIRLARTIATYLENSLREDIDQLSIGVVPLLDSSEPATARALAAALDESSRVTAFSEAAMVLDVDGNIVAAVPAGHQPLRDKFDFAALLAVARTRKDVVVSQLRHVGLKPVVLMVAPIYSRGRHLGFIGGVFQPARTDVLESFRRADDSGHTEFRVVDKHGTVIASTDRRSLYRRGDHGDVLADAISERRELQGRCHSCHQEGRERKTNVLAFAPMPSLDLGLAVHQPESEVLTPAFDLRRRMFFLGSAFIALFVLFAWLSVRAVVLPVRKLTAAVRRSETSNPQEQAPVLARDEVGDLARAMWTWRHRMTDSLAEAERHRHALNREIDATQRHLVVLEQIATLSTAATSLNDLVERALDEALTAIEVEFGVMCVRFRSREFIALRNLDRAEAETLCPKAWQRDSGEAAPASESIVIDDRSRVHRFRGEVLRTMVRTELRSPQGFDIKVMVADHARRQPIDRRWLDSLVRHVRMAVSNLLLREAIHEREEHQRHYLHRVLTAQEDERRRVARDLHDTLAQDLAALRLDIERLANRDEAGAIRAELEDLDERSQTTLVAVRRILLDLRLSVLDSMGFLPALQWQLERVQDSGKVRGTLVVDGDESTELAYETAVTLFRIAQESLGNAIQHGGAEQIFVTVEFADDSVVLTVEDDGCGFDVAGLREVGLRDSDRGLGILGMEERARLLGGHLTIDSDIGEGSRVVATVPLIVATQSQPVRPSHEAEAEQ